MGMVYLNVIALALSIAKLDKRVAIFVEMSALIDACNTRII